jgi:long-chain acyl-CoA synthetase
MSTAAMSSSDVGPRPNPIGEKPGAARVSADPSADASMVAWMLARLESSYDRPAVCDALDEGRTWTWGELVAAAVTLADRLNTVGLRRGQRIAHLGSHSPDWIVVDLACQLAGIVHVPLHADATSVEHAAQMAWLAPQGILWSGSWRGGGPETGVPITIDLRVQRRSNRDRSWDGIAASGLLKSALWQPRHADRGALQDTVSRYAESCDPDACSTILLSSGTTGRPKGVMHSQRTVVTNAVAATKVFLDEPNDVRLSWLPLSHSLARTGDLITALVRGGCLNVVTDRRRVLDACRVLPPTVVLGVPAFFERLERAAESGRISDLAAALGGRVRVCVSGGAALCIRTTEAFAARGLPLVQGYGLAEAGPVVTLSNPRIARPGTVGPPVEGVELTLDTRPATRGQLLVRTPSRALGVIENDTAGQFSLGAPPLPNDHDAPNKSIHAGRIDTGSRAAPPPRTRRRCR